MCSSLVVSYWWSAFCADTEHVRSSARVSIAQLACSLSHQCKPQPLQTGLPLPFGRPPSPPTVRRRGREGFQQTPTYLRAPSKRVAFARISAPREAKSSPFVPFRDSVLTMMLKASVSAQNERCPSRVPGLTLTIVVVNQKFGSFLGQCTQEVSSRGK